MGSVKRWLMRWIVFFVWRGARILAGRKNYADERGRSLNSYFLSSFSVKCGLNWVLVNQMDDLSWLSKQTFFSQRVCMFFGFTGCSYNFVPDRNDKETNLENILILLWFCMEREVLEVELVLVIDSILLQFGRDRGCLTNFQIVLLTFYIDLEGRYW